MRYGLIGLGLLGVVLGAVMLLREPFLGRTTHDSAVVSTSPSAEVSSTEASSKPLPSPSTMSVPAFEQELFEFVKRKRYIDLEWKHDKGVRDTGPFVDGTYYGTHPAVRVYYSPEVITWLEAGRKGPLPDGAVIIKEQYPAPAIRHAEKTEEQLAESLESWTIMVKDAAGSHDGWFWSNPAKDQQVVDNHVDFSHPISGFGMYCIRCHSATASPDTKPESAANEFTFASLRNIEGYPGEPILFLVDDSWRAAAAAEEEAAKQEQEEPATEEPTKVAARSKADGVHPRCTASGSATPCTAPINPDFAQFFAAIGPARIKDVALLPPVTHDWVAKRRDASQEFVTSNQCMSCHAGLLEPFGPTMFLPTGESAEYGAEGWNISPYGEWRWTPMGLAGRDPVFLAQLEAERTMLRKQFADDLPKAERLIAIVEDTCLKCHGAMGRHQFACDHEGTDKTFSLEHCDAVATSKEHIGRGKAQYGALAREGISCMVCHRMQPRPQPDGDDRPYLQFFLETSVSGNLFYGPPGEIYGPFKDKEITTYPMQHALGITPKHSEFLKSSQMCGSCHTVSLPAVDLPVSATEFDELNDSQVVDELTPFHHHVEQATYLEWLNSEFENEFRPDNPKAKTCQDCHMSRGLVDEQNGLDLKTLPTRMAIVQDTTYPDAENLASHEQLNVRVREEGYARHNFSGLNLFLLELFEQFDDVLGVRTEDYMTGSKLDIEHARRNFLHTARTQTADLELAVNWPSDEELTAEVTVRNKAGHRFPTGVGFRRAFIELMVVEKPQRPDGEERVLWSSGQTNSLGVIVDQEGQPLPTEFFDADGSGEQVHQPHHQTITSSDQVQIYESLLCNAKDRFTTSFLRGCRTAKDNRLLPRGWSKKGPGTDLSGRYLEATHPGRAAADDPQYQDGSGSDITTYQMMLPADIDPDRLEVRATLYYQAIPPYYLKNLFQSSPEGKATQRLHFLLSHADFSQSPIKDWKLMIATKSAPVQMPQTDAQPKDD